MEKVQKTLESWITSELCKARPEGQHVTKFILRTASAGSKGSEVDDFKIEHRMELEEIPMFAQNVLARAQEDADGNGPVVQRFMLLSYIKGESKPVGRCPFRLRGDSDLDLDDETGEEAPTNKGLLTQLMRHNEALTRGIATSAASMMSIMVRRLESSDRLNEHLMEKHQHTLETLENAKSLQHTRDMELMLTDGEQKRKDQMFEKLMVLVPLVINKVAGGTVLPAKTDPLMMLLEPLITSMSQEQLQAIGQNLRPEQMISFVELLKMFQQRQGNSKSEN